MRRFAPLDLALPGAGLLLDGRLAWALPILVPAILILAALAGGLLLGGFAADWTLTRLLPAYLLCAALAALVRLRLAARETIDPEAAKRLARDAAQAWLRDAPDATGKAIALTDAAPELAQAWRLRALVSGDARAARRAEAIERRG
jgi:hypothetical protein